MPLRDVLLQIQTYPQATPPEAIEQAVAFAAGRGARLSALAIETAIPLPKNRLADRVAGLAEVARQEEARSAEIAKASLEHFASAARAAGVLGEVRYERADLHEVASRVAREARLHDLCLIPIGAREDGQRAVAEAVVFGSGQPTLLFRPGVADLKREFALALVAWDGGRPAARALTDALPLLARAEEVRVLTVLNEKPDAVAGLAAEAVRRLRAHSIEAVPVEVDAKRRAIGRVLDDYAAAEGADLLVMGAFGRSRLREFILGGATEHVLHDPKVPLLLSH
ncbi:MAG: universal stress protein [Phenylobacterium sp.]|uniref:universal stress protein n=1 Tax=Phenylobacterium sp. TaxID=1871053 RepID=UPI00391DA727